MCNFKMMSYNELLEENNQLKQELNKYKMINRLRHFTKSKSTNVDVMYTTNELEFVKSEVSHA